MKKLRILILTSVLAAICIVNNSCSKFLEEKVYSFSTPEDLYTPEGIELAMTGVYDVMNASSIQGVGSQSLWGSRLNWILMLGDEVIADFTKLNGDRLNIASGALSTENAFISDAWFSLYVGVNRANNIINRVNAINISEERKKQIMAEARFFRGFYSIYLAWMFGAIPMPAGINDDPQAPRESLNIVYQKVEDDLRFAYDNLNHRNAKQGRVNKWTAASFLLKMYTYLASCKENNVGAELSFELNSFNWVNAMDYYQKSEALGKEIYQNSQYILLPSYRYNFLDVTRDEQASECPMVVQTGLNGNSDFYLLIDWVSPQGPDASGGGRGHVRSMGELKDKYNLKDLRYLHNITGIINASSKTEIIKNATFYIPNAVNSSGTQICLSKFRQSSGADRTALGVPGLASLLNFPIIRYADILLLYAEAKFKTGDESGARELVSIVRSRAAGGDAVLLNELNSSYRKENFMDELLDERSRELCGENWRRFDLIRMGKLQSVIQSLKTPSASDYRATVGAHYYFNMLGAQTVKENFFPYKIWFPIPKKEIDVNPNLVPNPGY